MVVVMFVSLSFQKELELPSSQLLGLFNRTMRKVVQVKKFISEGRVLLNLASVLK